MALLGGQRQPAVGVRLAWLAALGMLSATALSANSGLSPREARLTAALSQARDQQKLVALYWHAAWDPLAIDFDSSILARKDVSSGLRNFVYLPLNEEAPGAQEVADQLRIESGYPLFRIMNAEGKTVMIVRHDSAAGLYTRILSSARQSSRPMADLRLALRDPAYRPTLSECRQLAYHSWGMDREIGKVTQLADDLASAARNCPRKAEVERTRLAILSTFSADPEYDRLTNGDQPTPVTAQRVLAVHLLLKAGKIDASMADLLQRLSPNFFRALHRSRPDLYDQFLERFREIMTVASRSADFSDGQRLAILASVLSSYTMIDPAADVPEKQKAVWRARAVKILNRTGNGPSRASVIYHVQGFIEPDESVKLLEAELNRSSTPWYWMLTLASYAEMAKDRAAQDHWLRLGYNQSRGRVARVRWGTNFIIKSLVTAQPNSVAEIEQATVMVVAELDHPQQLHGDTLVRLRRLDRALRNWSKGGKYAASIMKFRLKLDEICKLEKRDEIEAKACDELFKLSPPT